jgi:hypothetical protein
MEKVTMGTAPSAVLRHGRREEMIDPYYVDWNVRADRFGWTDQPMARYDLTPEKLEMLDGKLCGTEADRLRLLGLLLENRGANTAVRFGDPEVRRQAVASVNDVVVDLRFRVEAMLRQWDDIDTREEALSFYSKWTLPAFVEAAARHQRTVAEIAASYPEQTDWHDFTYWRTRLDHLEVACSNASVHVVRQWTTQSVLVGRVCLSRIEESWELRWQDRAIGSRDRQNQASDRTANRAYSNGSHSARGSGAASRRRTGRGTVTSYRSRSGLQSRRLESSRVLSPSTCYSAVVASMLFSASRSAICCPTCATASLSTSLLRAINDCLTET